MERYLKMLEHKVRELEADLDGEKVKYNHLVQEHARAETIRVARQAEDSGKIQQLQREVAELRERVHEYESHKPFDGNIVFRTPVPGEDPDELRIAWNEINPMSPEETILLQQSSAATLPTQQQQPPPPQDENHRGPMNVKIDPWTPTPGSGGPVASAPASQPQQRQRRRSRSLKPTSSGPSRLHAKTISQEMRQSADAHERTMTTDLHAYLRKPAKKSSAAPSQPKPAFVSSAGGRSFRFGTGARRGSAAIEIPASAFETSKEPPSITVDFSV